MQVFILNTFNYLASPQHSNAQNNKGGSVATQKMVSFGRINENIVASGRNKFVCTRKTKYVFNVNSSFSKIFFTKC